MQNSDSRQKKRLTTAVAMLYVALGESEQKFNELQSGYRRLASIWVLAAFSAIGYIWANPLPEGISMLIICGAILVLCSAGITLLWLIDIFVLHKLLSATFREGLAFEKEYHVPQTRHRTRELFENSSASRKLFMYYAIPASLMLPVGLLLIVYDLFSPSGLPLALYVIGSICIGILTFELMRHNSGVAKYDLVPEKPQAKARMSGVEGRPQ